MVVIVGRVLLLPFLPIVVRYSGVQVQSLFSRQGPPHRLHARPRSLAMHRTDIRIHRLLLVRILVRHVHRRRPSRLFRFRPVTRRTMGRERTRQWIGGMDRPSRCPPPPRTRPSPPPPLPSHRFPKSTLPKHSRPTTRNNYCCTSWRKKKPRIDPITVPIVRPAASLLTTVRFFQGERVRPLP